jgi:glycosyltransferase involved in cell wall biosynthesis
MARVYLFAGPHPVFENLVKHPPKGIEFKTNINLNDYRRVSIYTDKKYVFLKRFVSKTIGLFGFPRALYFSDAKDCDLIHSSRAVIPINNQKWVIDFEHSVVFGNLKNPITKFIIQRAFQSKNCKKIIAHCHAAEMSLRNAMDCSAFSDKITTLHFAVELPRLVKKKDKKIRILHISGRGDFYAKGVRELVLAAEILTKKYPNSEFWIRAIIPEEWKKRISANPQIRIIEGFIPKDKLYAKFYSKGDIFCSASYTESFGYPFLEAMAAGLPCVGNKIFAIPELIEDKKSGFLIDPPISWADQNFQAIVPDLSSERISQMDLGSVVNQLVEKISLLIENQGLRKKMGKYGRKLAEEKFSIKSRNEKLLNLYKEAIKE